MRITYWPSSHDKRLVTSLDAISAKRPRAPQNGRPTILRSMFGLVRILTILLSYGLKEEEEDGKEGAYYSR